MDSDVKKTGAWEVWNAPNVGGRLKVSVGEPTAFVGRAGSGIGPSWPITG